MILNSNFILTLGRLQSLMLYNNIKNLLRSIFGLNYLLFLFFCFSRGYLKMHYLTLPVIIGTLNFKMVENIQTSLIFMIFFLVTVFTFAILIP